MLSEKEYAGTGGTICPVCESGNISTASPLDYDIGIAWQDVKCDDCGASWTDEYKLIGYSNLEKR